MKNQPTAKKEPKTPPRVIMIRVICFVLAVLMVGGIAYATLAGIFG